ncbi:MAG: glycine zipper family protein [Legionella sp.]
MAQNKYEITVVHYLDVLKTLRPDLVRKLNELRGRMFRMREEQIQILEARLADFVEIQNLFVGMNAELEWMVRVDPDLMKKANKQFAELENKLLGSKKLDNIQDSTWHELMIDFFSEVEKIQDPNQQIQAAFLKHFGSGLKTEALNFLGEYKQKMQQLTQQKNEIKHLAGDTIIDEAILDAEIAKQLKLVQAEVILAMTAASARAKAEKLKLASAYLTAASLAIGGAGIGTATVAVAGSAVPVAGTLAGAAIGFVAGAAIGGTKGYHAYQEAKAQYKIRLVKVFDYNSQVLTNRAASINDGISSIKARESFIWFMEGPRNEDYQRMYANYEAESVDPLDPVVKKDLDAKLQSEFATSRAAYFTMLQNLIRSSTADSALQAAAGLNSTPAFDTYSAVDIATQFIIMCHSQIGAARAMGGLDPDPNFTSGHIQVDNSKNLAQNAASQLAYNAECLAALIHQIATCTNLDSTVRADILKDIKHVLITTIDNYDSILKKNPDLNLHPSLGQALLAGMFGDIEKMGSPSSEDKSSQEQKAYQESKIALDYMASSKFHSEELDYYHKNQPKKKESKSRTAADYGENILVAMLGGASAVYTLPIELVNAEKYEHLSKVGSSGYTVVGVSVGAALGGLALAAGAGAYYMNERANKTADKLCIFGNISQRRQLLYQRLQNCIELSERTEYELHSLIETPYIAAKIKAHWNAGLLVNEAKFIQHNEDLKTAGWIDNSFLTREQKTNSSIALEQFNKTMDEVVAELSAAAEQKVIDNSYKVYMDFKHNGVMKVLRQITTLSEVDRFGVEYEHKLICSIGSYYKQIRKIVSNMDDSKKLYHEQKISEMESEINQIIKVYATHVEIVLQGPRNLIAMEIDSSKINENLDLLIKSLKSEENMPSKKEINRIINKMIKVINLHDGELPTGTNLNLLTQARKISTVLEETIPEEMIATLRSKQEPEILDDLGGMQLLRGT